MELNLLELEFLVRVGWRIVPKGEVLEEYYRSLIGRLQTRYTIAGGEMGDENGEGLSDSFGSFQPGSGSGSGSMEVDAGTIGATAVAGR